MKLEINNLGSLFVKMTSNDVEALTRFIENRGVEISNSDEFIRHIERNQSHPAPVLASTYDYLRESYLVNYDLQVTYALDQITVSVNGHITPAQAAEVLRTSYTDLEITGAATIGGRVYVSFKNPNYFEVKSHGSK